MKPRTAVCLLSAILIAGCGEKNGRKAFGKISETIGQTEMCTAGTAGWSAAQVGATVRSGDSLRTKNESSLTVEFDGNTMKLGENTTVGVVDSMAGDTSRSIRIFDRSGEVLSEIKHLMKGRESYQVSTPTAVSSIRGTHFVVFFSPVAWSTDVKVLDGTVWVVNPFVPAPPVAIMPGFFSTIVLRELPHPPAPMNFGQFKRLERSLGGRHYDHYLKRFNMRRDEPDMLMPLVPFPPPPRVPEEHNPRHADREFPGPGGIHPRGAPPMLGPLPPLPGFPVPHAPGHPPKEAKKEKEKEKDGHGK